MLGKIILILLFLGCKDVKSTNSSNGIVSSKTVKKEGEISFEKQFFKYDSCNISEGKFQVFLFKKKDEINEVIVEIFNKNNSLIDSTRLSLVDNPSIKLHCEEGNFALEYENNIGNNYNSVIHKFDWNNVTESFVATKVRVIKDTSTLAGINAVKKQIFYEQIDLSTNKSKVLKYEVVESTNFKVKSDIRYIDWSEGVAKNKKAFSQYFNSRDIGNILKQGVTVARSLLKILDFVNMTETIFSVMPKDGDSKLSIPNPNSVIGAVSSFAMPAAFPLSAVFLLQI
ncbi:hypothetical protein Celal_1955 [Cellulophaga algicola DSM 14237]|uniref:Uncharacterized protein n=2 Tax=Cellulophaga TaxID=104264 RepID=E6XF31_CELAD|nr:hypothetical protein Celal_1955 [Cellulophaga algicola DSM 14237]